MPFVSAPLSLPTMSSGDRSLVTYICESIADICGINIEMILPSAKEQTYEILLGNTGRELTSKEIPLGTFSLEQTDTKLAIYGKGDSSDTYILKHFIVDILLSIPIGDSYDIKLDNISGQPFELKTLVSTNLPDVLPDLTGVYDYEVVSTDVTLDRFFATMDELPEEEYCEEDCFAEDIAEEWDETEDDEFCEVDHADYSPQTSQYTVVKNLQLFVLCLVICMVIACICAIIKFN